MFSWDERPTCKFAYWKSHGNTISLIFIYFVGNKRIAAAPVSLSKGEGVKLLLIIMSDVRFICCFLLQLIKLFVIYLMLAQITVYPMHMFEP